MDNDVIQTLKELLSQVVQELLENVLSAKDRFLFPNISQRRIMGEIGLSLYDALTTLNLTAHEQILVKRAFLLASSHVYDQGLLIYFANFSRAYSAAAQGDTEYIQRTL